MNLIEITKEFNEKFSKELNDYLRSNTITEEKSIEIATKEVRERVIKNFRKQKENELFTYTNRNVVVYFSSFMQLPNVPGSFTMINDNDINGFTNAISNLDLSKGLDLILHTPGGVTSATEMIIKYLRKMFKNNIRVIVPHLAMSAGTLIACSSKEILMGKQSSLGPVDPQYRDAPALGIIKEFNMAKEDVKRDPNTALIWREIISKYPPSYYNECLKVSELTEEILRNCLETVMFKNCKNKKGKINNIIKELDDKDCSKIHDRHFDFDKCKEIGLKVKELEKDEILNDKVLAIYYSLLLSVYLDSTIVKIIESNGGIQMVNQYGNKI